MLVCVAILIGSVVFSGCGGAADARLATFVGHWHGPARGLDVYRSGRGKEYIGTGNPPIATLTFDVLRVAGTHVVADAQIRVTSVRITDRSALFGFLLTWASWAPSACEMESSSTAPPVSSTALPV